MSDKSKIVAIVAVVFLILLWVSRPTSSPEPEKKSEMSVFKSEYMGGCFDPKLDGSYSYCECTYAYLDSRLTDKGLLDLAQEYEDTGETPKLMNDAINSCLSEFE